MAGVGALRLPLTALFAPRPVLLPECLSAGIRRLLFCTRIFLCPHPLAGSLPHAAPQARVGAAPGDPQPWRWEGRRCELGELRPAGSSQPLVYLVPKQSSSPRAKQSSPWSQGCRGRGAAQTSPPASSTRARERLPEPYLSFSVSRSFSKWRCSFWPGGAPIAHTQYMLLDWFPV